MNQYRSAMATITSRLGVLQDASEEEEEDDEEKSPDVQCCLDLNDPLGYNNLPSKALIGHANSEQCLLAYMRFLHKAGYSHAGRNVLGGSIMVRSPANAQ